MKKPLILFILFVILFIIAKIVYSKYCESSPGGCKKEKSEDREDHPIKGVDW